MALEGQIKFLSTPSARRATLVLLHRLAGPPISIHALREEGDLHPEEYDAMPRKIFLSTPSARRATAFSMMDKVSFAIFLSTPSARRATAALHPFCICWRFLSTPSARRATYTMGDRGELRNISIHALREEGDIGTARQQTRPRNFYPRPPRGGRRSLQRTPAVSMPFLSTPSARRATAAGPGSLLPHGDFYPRPPRGGRRLDLQGFQLADMISIHALREEGDITIRVNHQGVRISIHALREEGDKA